MQTACESVLGTERLNPPTVDHFRHTFITHALADHDSLTKARDAADHANVSSTSAYLHVAVEDEAVGNLLGPR